MNNLVAKLLAMGILLAAMTGCFPYATSYVRLEAPGIENTGGCAGPPVFASFEAQGARIDVTLEPGFASRSSAGFLRVRAPGDMPVSLGEGVGYVMREGQAPLQFRLDRVELPEERFAREILRAQGRAEHRFAFSGLPPIAFSGTLRLPTLYLGGVAADTPALKFERRPWAGVVPLNC
jgi:hypothetical protein